MLGFYRFFRCCFLIVAACFFVFYAVGQTCADESFVDAGNSGSYGSISWTGDDGADWDATDARSDVDLNGDEAIMLRVGSLTNADAFANGMGVLTFDYARIYSGNSTLKVFVNGTQYGGGISVSNTTSSQFSATINETGDIYLELENTGKRTLINNLTWTCFSAIEHTVTFSSNGGSGSMSPQSASTSTGLTANAFTRIGYAFLGWNTASDGSGVDYDDEATYDFSADITLYAQWQLVSTDTEVNLTSVSSSYDESDGSFQICTSIINPSPSQATTVELAIFSGTGSADDVDDYSTQTLTFPANSTDNQCVTIAITDAQDCEGTETIVFELQNISGGTNAGIGSNNQYTLTLNDNDYVIGAFKTLSFESGDDLTYSGDGSTNSTTNKYYGTTSYRLGSAQALTTETIDISGYNDVTLQVAFASYGCDSGEDLYLEISYDNGATWDGDGSIKLVDGYSNANIDIGATNGSNPTTVGANPWTVNVDDAESQIAVRLRSTSLDNGEYYYVDDIILSGTVCNVCSGKPTTASSSSSVSSVTLNSATLNWVNGDGENRMVIIKESTAVGANPIDGTTYNASSVFASGDGFDDGYVVYKGDGNSVDVSVLNPGTIYHYAIIEYNCLPGIESYLTADVETGSFITTPVNPENLSVVCATSTTAILEWDLPSEGNYDAVMLVARENAVPHSVNSLNGNTQSFDLDYSLAPTFGSTLPNTRVLYKGTGTSASVEGLSNGVSYTFKMFTYQYDETSTETEWSSGTQTVAVAEISDVNNVGANKGNTIVSLNWTNVDAMCFDEVLIVANSSTNTYVPSGDGSAYTADNSFTGTGTVVGSSKVVYKGSSTDVTVTSLTNFTTYYFKVFVRFGTHWSDGVEVSATPDEEVVFEPGDLAIVSVNTKHTSSGSNDELCFVAFRDITSNTAIDLTDNGYERMSAETWGNSEGTIRMTRTGSTVPAGQVICLQGAGYDNSGFSVYTCGSSDDANWDISSLNETRSFDFNENDQIWILQGGNWTSNTIGNHDATYTGNILYGWTATGWKTSVGYDNSAGSTLPDGFNCFYTDLNSISVASDKVKFTGDLSSSKNRREWITEINDIGNWTGYSSNTNYYSAARVYTTSCYTFQIDAGSLGDNWLGDKNTNWFDCNNWGDLRVPVDSSNVLIETKTMLPVIDITYDFALDYNQTARVKSVTIKNGGSLTINENSELHVSDSISIDGNNTFVTLSGSKVIFDANNNSIFRHNQTELTIHGLSIENSASTTLLGDFEILEEVNIDLGCTLNVDSVSDVTIDQDMNVDGNLFVGNNSGWIQTENSPNATGTGMVTLVRQQSTNNTGAGVFNHWSAPVSSAILGAGGAINGVRNYRYPGGEDDNADYVRVTSPLAMAVGQGYSSLGNTVATFSGNVSELNNGYNAIEVDLDALQEEDADADDNEYYLVGNPFPSALSAFEFLDKNNGTDNEILGTIYVFSQQNSFGSYSRTGDNIAVNILGASDPGPDADRELEVDGSPDFNIASGQGFFVIKKGAYTSNDKVTFDNSMRVKGNDNFKSTNTQSNIKGRFWLYANTETAYKSTLIGLASDATFGQDDKYDAPKFPSNSALDIWTAVGDDKFEIQAIPDVQKATYRIPVNLNLPSAGNFSIRAFSGKLYEGKSIALLDTKEGTIHDVRTVTEYYSSESGLIQNRFYLLFQGSGSPNPVSVDEMPTSTFRISNTDQAVRILWSEDDDLESIEMLTLDGKSIGRYQVDSSQKEMSIPTVKKEMCVLRFFYQDGQVQSVLWQR
jgi:uncharacterized repeat protein (TIGR02543 family)